MKLLHMASQSTAYAVPESEDIMKRRTYLNTMITTPDVISDGDDHPTRGHIPLPIKYEALGRHPGMCPPSRPQMRQRKTRLRSRRRRVHSTQSKYINKAIKVRSGSNTTARVPQGRQADTPTKPSYRILGAFQLLHRLAEYSIRRSFPHSFSPIIADTGRRWGPLAWDRVSSSTVWPDGQASGTVDPRRRSTFVPDNEMVCCQHVYS